MDTTLTQMIDKFIAGLPVSRRELAKLYVPVLTRWVNEAGWGIVRSALYAQSQLSWYKAVRKRMTTSERLADDKRAREWVKALGTSKAERVRRERMVIQAVITQLPPALLAKL